MFAECRPISAQDLQVHRGDRHPSYSPPLLTRILRILWCLRFVLIAAVLAIVIYKMVNDFNTFADQSRKRAAQKRRIRQPQRLQLQKRLRQRVRRRGLSAV